MAKPHKHSGHKDLTPLALRERIQRAAGEGRFQQALDLAKQLHKQEAKPESLQMLREMYLGRARQLRGQGFTKDAVATIQAALPQMENEQAWLEKIAEELAICGNVKQALELLQRMPGSSAQPAILARAVDAAVQQEAAGRALLPAELHEGFDRILRAANQIELGQDEEAKETLQPLGLRSPFLEWKLMLRGLSAYFQNDDLRALENWQRLAPDRLPARLIAPMRFQIDSAFRAAQPQATQQVLQRIVEQTFNHGVGSTLRQIQTALATQQQLQEAFRLAEALAPQMRQQVPHMVLRLARCFYWAIIYQGEERDRGRYLRIFGSPADDPKLERMGALGAEHVHDMANAHKFWLAYEKTIADNPQAFPEGQAKLVRALIWQRMGKNAALTPSEGLLNPLQPLFRERSFRPEEPRPTAEECFQNSLRLAPDQVETHEELFYLHRLHAKPKKAAQAAESLLDRFPDHAVMLSEYGQLCMEQQNYARAVELYERAVQSNPLDRKLRRKLGAAHLFRARMLAEEGQFDAARAGYQTALHLNEHGDTASVLCKWAACEFKAGEDTRAEELLRQALAKESSHLAVSYSMLIETIRLKLKRSIKQRFDQEFNAALAEAPTGAGAAAIAETTHSHILANVTYVGQKTHQKKVLAYLEKARTVAFSEAELERICAALRGLGNSRQLNSYAKLGQHRFPTSPFFHLIEAQALLDQGPNARQLWRARPLLDVARQLAQALPPDERQKQMQEEIQQTFEKLSLVNPFLAAMERLMGGFLDGDEFEDDWEDEPDDE